MRIKQLLSVALGQWRHNLKQAAGAAIKCGMHIMSRADAAPADQTGKSKTHGSTNFSIEPWTGHSRQRMAGAGLVWQGRLTLGSPRDAISMMFQLQRWPQPAAQQQERLQRIGGCSGLCRCQPRHSGDRTFPAMVSNLLVTIRQAPQHQHSRQGKHATLCC